MKDTHQRNGCVRVCVLPARASGARRGSALVVVLWVISLLSVLVTGFAFDMHVEAKMTSYYKKRVQADYLARAGIQRSQWLLTRSRYVNDDFEAEYGGEWWYSLAERLARGGCVTYTEKLGNGSVTITIEAEPARRNMNKLSNDEWEKIFESSGVAEDRWPALISAIRDWMDSDDTPLPDGAETPDYYATLRHPYKAKNGNFDTVHELRLVKGFHPQDEERSEEGLDEYVHISGFAGLLTTYGDGRVNVNSAGVEVLMTLPEMTEIIADDIIAEREGAYLDEPSEEETTFEDEADLFSRVPLLDSSLRGKLTTSANIFRIRSVGRVGGVEHTASCVSEAHKHSMRVLRWREHDDMG